MKMSRRGAVKGASAPTWHDPTPLRQKKRNFRQWLYDYINQAYISKDAPESGIVSSSTDPFNKSFEGWHIRLHKANGGHIVEAWKNEDQIYNSSSGSSRRLHELFMVQDDEDLGAKINDILVQLMLRG